MPRYKGTFLLGASANATSIDLSWEAPAGPPPKYYDVKRDGTKIATQGVGSRVYADSTVTAGVSYVYQVRAYGSYSSEGEALSNLVTSRTLDVPKPLTAPVLTGTSGAAEVSLTWTAVLNAASYSWQRATGAGAFGTSTATTALSAIDATAVSGTTYRYRVMGTTTATNGPWSNIVTVIPTTGVPVAPTLTGEPGDNLNNLDWNAVANAATYRLRRSIAGAPVTLLVETTATDYIDDTAVNGTSYQYTVRGLTAGGVLGSISTPVDLIPVAATPAEEPPAVATIVGYGAGVTGGTGGTTTNVTTWAEFKAACQDSGPRIITFDGAPTINGNGDNVQVNNGNLTIDGTGWTHSLRNYKMTVRTSNIIIKQLRLRPGDEAGAGNVEDWAPIKFFSSTTGGIISGIVLDHCSLMWGPDVILGILGNTTDVTVQYCELGPALYSSAVSSSPNGYGPNVTTINSQDPTTIYTKRITFYRNFMSFNTQRNLKYEHTDGAEAVNNAIYNWGNQLGHGNPRTANIVGNMFKKGPQTTSSTVVWVPDSTYAEYSNSTYFPLSGVDANIGIGFTPTVTIGSLARRTTLYGGGLHGVSMTAASEALFDEVVSAAGPDTPDSVSTTVKNHALNGTSAGMYNGVGFASPHPTWP